MMSEFVTLSCPTCGGKLLITSDIERFACAHCGREHIVRRSDGVVSIAPLVKGLKKVETGDDRATSQIAIMRLQEELSRHNRTLNEVKSAISNLQLQRDTPRTEGSLDGCANFAIGIGILGFFFLCFGLITGQKIPGELILGFILWLAMGVGLKFILGGLHSSNRHSQLDPEIEKWSNKIPEIQQEIERVQQEITKHEKILEQ